jgi:hypothetical protein
MMVIWKSSQMDVSKEKSVDKVSGGSMEGEHDPPSNLKLSTIKKMKNHPTEDT